MFPEPAATPRKHRLVVAAQSQVQMLTPSSGAMRPCVWLPGRLPSQPPVLLIKRRALSRSRECPAGSPWWSPKGPSGHCVPEDPWNAQVCASPPSGTPETFPVAFQYVPSSSYCILTVLWYLSSGDPVRPPALRVGNPRRTLGTVRKAPVCPGCSTTHCSHSGPLMISQPVPRSAWCSPPKVPACSEECASTWPQHPTVPAGLPVDSNSQSASASSPEESLLSLHSPGLPTSGERASPVGRGGEGEGVENNIC